MDMEWRKYSMYGKNASHRKRKLRYIIIKTDVLRPLRPKKGQNDRNRMRCMVGQVLYKKRALFKNGNTDFRLLYCSSEAWPLTAFIANLEGMLISHLTWQKRLHSVVEAPWKPLVVRSHFTLVCKIGKIEYFGYKLQKFKNSDQKI